jgi:hypothetical protein
MREVIADCLSDFFPGGAAEVREWLEDERKDNALIPELGVTLRHCLQTLGTSWGRVCVHPDLWVLKVKKAIWRAERWADLVVVDDVRMPNEFWMLRKLGATMVRIMRPDAPPTPHHQSNGQLEGYSGFDYCVTNDGCPTELAMQAQAHRPGSWAYDRGHERTLHPVPGRPADGRRHGRSDPCGPGAAQAVSNPTVTGAEDAPCRLDA